MTESHDVAVIGAGDMGHGFAAHFSMTGQNVTLIDHRDSNIAEAKDRIREVVDFHVEEELTDLSAETVVEAVDFTVDRAAGVADADIVLETITEDLEVKRDLFSSLADEAPADAILSSNTSGIPITGIAEGAPRAADRIVGCHWWFPPYLMLPVEVVRGEETSDETVDRTRAFVEAVDRKPLTVERDVPGFVWNRVQMAVVRECTHLAAEGVASVEDINMAIRDGYARRTAVIGPFETIDIAGLDLFQTVAGDVYPHLCDDDGPNELFDEHLAADRGGIDDGAGFFDYDEPPEAVTRERDVGLAALLRTLGGEE